jgi:hypothetical protein
MQELIERMRTLLNGLNEAPLTADEWGRYRGMHDLLLAMESRVGTLKYRIVYPNDAWPSIEYLLEKA